MSQNLSLKFQIQQRSIKAAFCAPLAAWGSTFHPASVTIPTAFDWALLSLISVSGLQMFNYLSWKRGMVIYSLIIVLLKSLVLPQHNGSQGKWNPCCNSHRCSLWNSDKDEFASEKGVCSQGRGCGWEILNGAVFIWLFFCVQDMNLSWRGRLRHDVPVIPGQCFLIVCSQHRGAKTPGNARLSEEHHQVPLLGKRAKGKLP